MQERKKSWRDRWDGWYIGGLDPVHVMMPYFFGNRTINEAVLGEVMDLTEVDKHLITRFRPFLRNVASWRTSHYAFWVLFV